jgi:hypothetical protein
VEAERSPRATYRGGREKGREGKGERQVSEEKKKREKEVEFHKKRWLKEHEKR